MIDSKLTSDGKLLQQVLELRKLNDEKQCENKRLEQLLKDLKQSYSHLEEHNKKLSQQTIKMKEALEQKQTLWRNLILKIIF